MKYPMSSLLIMGLLLASPGVSVEEELRAAPKFDHVVFVSPLNDTIESWTWEEYEAARSCVPSTPNCVEVENFEENWWNVEWFRQGHEGNVTLVFGDRVALPHGVPGFSTHVPAAIDYHLPPTLPNVMFGVGCLSEPTRLIETTYDGVILYQPLNPAFPSCMTSDRLAWWGSWEMIG